jgi:hypothetical protein
MSCPTEIRSRDARSLHALSAGAFALQRLKASGSGRTVAKFTHSLYVRFATGSFACVGTQAIGAGPLNVLLAQCDWIGLHALPLGAPVEASKRALSFADAHRVMLTRAASWRPHRITFRRDVLSRQLRVLARLAPPLLPEIGLSRLAFAPPSRSTEDPAVRHAAPGWDALERWIARCMTEPVAMPTPHPSMSRLIGLGPGLTPSGDDVFCGVLVALDALGLDAAVATLWSWLRPQLAEGTSALSAAHLGAAAVGQGHSALHAVLECTAANESALDIALIRLGQVGHCSGWDALAGAVAVLRAYAARDAVSRTASSAACAFDGATVTPACSSVRHCAE